MANASTKQKRVCRTVNINIASLLKTDDAKDYIYSNFEKHDVVAVFSFENNKANEVTVVGMNGAQTRKPRSHQKFYP